MCGISGVIAPRDTDWPQRLVARVVDYQRPRGPDAHAIEHFAESGHQIVLGHNRLSIIDLVEASNQPFTSNCGTATLVFNGEIYNYKELRAELIGRGRRFRTASDSEVLLEAYLEWGTAALDRFIGMFAFAIFDRARRLLLLARDRFGVKPLYYRTDGKSLSFASTAGVIAQWHQAPINLEYVGRGLHYKYYEDDSDISPFKGVPALEPSHLLLCRWNEGGVSITKQRYYDLKERVGERADELAAKSSAALVAALRERLDDATHLRLRSDVPVGLSLSGGLDSSSIAALAGARARELVAFSYGQPDDKFSEGPLARQVAERAGIDLRFIWPDDAGLDRLFQATLRAQGAPFPHTSQMAQYAVFERVRRHGVKVLLGGQGGDEALMGYRKFFLFRLQELRRTRDLVAVPGFLLNVAQLLPALAPRANIFWSERKRYSDAGGGMATRLVLPELANTAPPTMTSGQTLCDRQIEDITRYSIPTLLRYEDRNSMGNSVESRLPFMDHRFIEFGISLPVGLKLARGYGKYGLRQAMARDLPRDVVWNRNKRGFDTQQADWINAGLGNSLRAALRRHASDVRALLPRGADIDTLFDDRQLIEQPQALKEAISLIWLADPLAGWRPESAAVPETTPMALP